MHPDVGKGREGKGCHLHFLRKGGVDVFRNDQLAQMTERQASNLIVTGSSLITTLFLET